VENNSGAGKEILDVVKSDALHTIVIIFCKGSEMPPGRIGAPTIPLQFLASLQEWSR